MSHLFGRIEEGHLGRIREGPPQSRVETQSHQLVNLSCRDDFQTRSRSLDQKLQAGLPLGCHLDFEGEAVVEEIQRSLLDKPDRQFQC